MKSYYKIQYFDKTIMSYVDVQKRFSSIEELMGFVKRSKTWRVMEITGKNRHIILPSSLKE